MPEPRMRDRRFIVLLVLITVFVTAHNIDHVVRGDLPLPLSAASLPFLVVVSVIYALIGLTFYAYARRKIGPRFFIVAGLAGLAFGWLSHFSPYTDQPASYILKAYDSAAAGWLALSTLLGIMLGLAAIVLYAGCRLMRGAG
jgi:hypothetical protein